MEVVVQVAPEVVDDLRRGVPPPAIAHALAELGMVLRPQHPDVSDPQLRRYFVATVPDAAAARRAADRLRQCAGVTAAYVKPPDEPP
jgi:hypothetical protein